MFRLMSHQKDKQQTENTTNMYMIRCLWLSGSHPLISLLCVLLFDESAMVNKILLHDMQNERHMER